MQYHVFYRTQAMANQGLAGWLRADVLADDPEAAMLEVAQKKRLLAVRVYPGPSCASWNVKWLPQFAVAHEPHEDTP